MHTQEARAHPDNIEAVGRLAITLHAWEQWDAAAATYRVAQRLAPKDRRWWYLDGLLETARGRHGDALPLFERAAALAPDDRAGVLRVAEARLETGDIKGSEPLFAELVREPGTLAPAEYGLGRVAMSRADYAGAVGHFERAVAAFPSSVPRITHSLWLIGGWDEQTMRPGRSNSSRSASPAGRRSRIVSQP